MGGGSYDRDVGSGSSSGSFYDGGTSSSSAKAAFSNDMDESLSPHDRKIISLTKSPVVVSLDVTGSNIEFARIVYDKSPMLYGQIEQQGYLKDFDICFTATGDAYSDDAPLQVCDFKKGKSLDDELEKLYLEGNGGGQQKETYEIAAYFFGKKCEMPNAEMPFFFYIADEAPYAKINHEVLNDLLGTKLKEDISAKKAFSDLYKKFNGNVFILQNPYNGAQHGTGYTAAIKSQWIDCIGKENAEKIIPIKEEKSIVDLMLGTIAMVSRTRSLDSYTTDLVARKQSKARIANVKSSLSNLEQSLVPYAGGVNLPVKKGGTTRSSGGKRI